jgi:hypothetical protein
MERFHEGHVLSASAVAGDEQSPLGELFAAATRRGYRASEGHSPYHAYYYKILTRHGTVFQKDFGPDTTKFAEAISSFNPDPTWTKVQAE